jgi:hypothetical protein
VSRPAEVHYYRVGMVERGPRFRWHEAYSVVVERRVEYPWLTMAEARKQAHAQGHKPVFHKGTCCPDDALKEAEVW